MGNHANRFVELEKFLNNLVPDTLPGLQILVHQSDKEVFYFSSGHRSVENNLKIERNNVFRIFSMTKALVCTGMMVLIEAKKVNLDDLVEKYIPEFQDLQVFDSYTNEQVITVEPKKKMTIKNLMTHTAGFTYPFSDNTKVNEMYGQVMSNPNNLNMSNQDFINEISKLPLLYSPGDFWNYSISIDILGFIIERISGLSLQDFLYQQILSKLNMNHTGFTVRPEHKDLFTSNYSKNEKGYDLLDSYHDSKYLSEPSYFSGGGGGVSSIDDYMKFCSFLQSEGIVNGEQILSSKSIDLLMSNQLDGDIGAISRPTSESVHKFNGFGQGLGGAVVIDPNNPRIPKAALGEFFWFGAACSMFYVDRSKEISMVFMTQMMNYIFGEEGTKMLDDIKTLVHESI